MATDLATVKGLLGKSDNGPPFKPSAFLNKKGTEAVPIINHRDAFRGVSPGLVCEILEHADDALQAVVDALEYASNPETLAALTKAKADKESGKSKGADDTKDRAAALADKLRKKSEESQAA